MDAVFHRLWEETINTQISPVLGVKVKQKPTNVLMHVRSWELAVWLVFKIVLDFTAVLIKLCWLTDEKKENRTSTELVPVLLHWHNILLQLWSGIIDPSGLSVIWSFRAGTGMHFLGDSRLQGHRQSRAWKWSGILSRQVCTWEGRLQRDPLSKLSVTPFPTLQKSNPISDSSITYRLPLQRFRKVTPQGNAMTQSQKGKGKWMKKEFEYVHMLMQPRVGVLSWTVKLCWLTQPHYTSTS